MCVRGLLTGGGVGRGGCGLWGVMYTCVYEGASDRTTGVYVETRDTNVTDRQ